MRGHEMKNAYRVVKVKVVRLDVKSSPSVVLMGIVDGVAKFKEQKWNRTKATTSQRPPKCCIAMEAAGACSEMIA